MARRPLALLVAIIALALALLAATGVQGHPERPTLYPPLNQASVPEFRTTGRALVVCKRSSKKRLKRSWAGRPRKLKKRLRLLKRCRYRHIQSAVNKARSGYRILIMPGVYREEPSRKVPFGVYQEGPCPNDYVETEGFTNQAPPPGGPRSNDPPVRPNRDFHRKCPNSHNLIAIIGDTRPEPDPTKPLLPKCLQLCNLQIIGMGRKATDVVIVGDRRKMDVIRADRADGLYLGNLTVEQAAFNGIDIVETSGFAVRRVVARYNQNYGVLSFTSNGGLYEYVDAYGNGDSGVYPGSAQKGCDYVDPNAYGLCDRATPTDSRAGCGAPTTEIRHSTSHHNLLGYSGTAGNSTYVHDNEFYANNTGGTTDSFALGHPGMPQECYRFENNKIYSNNNNIFTAERQEECNRNEFEQRPRELVCPQFPAPSATGLLIGGGNRNLVKENYIYDHWRWGVILIWVPAVLRDDRDPTHQNDTSNGNQFIGNHMGLRPDGTADPNGLDFYWDEQGARNCWQGNISKSGEGRQSDPANLPECPGSDVVQPADLSKSGLLVPCTAWDPLENPRPVGCDWYDLPPEPQP